MKILISLDGCASGVNIILRGDINLENLNLTPLKIQYFKQLQWKTTPSRTIPSLPMPTNFTQGYQFWKIELVIIDI